MKLLNTLVSFLRDKEYRDLIITTILVLIFGSAAYRYFEGWPWLDCIYFSVVTLTTVGFGDFAPHTDGGKIFTIIYIVIGIGIILSFVDALYNHFSRNTLERRNKLRKRD
jgi:hypothetical protein